MTQEDKTKIIAECLATKEGRDKLAAAMTVPLRTTLDYRRNEPWRLNPDIEINKDVK